MESTKITTRGYGIREMGARSERFLLAQARNWRIGFDPLRILPGSTFPCRQGHMWENLCMQRKRFTGGMGILWGCYVLSGSDKLSPTVQVQL